MIKNFISKYAFKGVVASFSAYSATHIIDAIYSSNTPISSVLGFAIGAGAGSGFADRRSTLNHECRNWGLAFGAAFVGGAVAGLTTSLGYIDSLPWWSTSLVGLGAVGVVALTERGIEMASHRCSFWNRSVERDAPSQENRLEEGVTGMRSVPNIR